MESIRSAMKNVRVPTTDSRVFNDECMFSFDTPESPDGLYTNLNSWQSFGEPYVFLDHKKTGNVLYLHQKWWRIPNKKDTTQINGVPQGNKPAKLAIGVPGGFDVEEKDYVLKKENSVVVMPENARVPFPSLGLPSIVTMCIEGILEHKGFAKSQAIAAYEETDERKVSKYAESLVQLDNGKKISADPKAWRCEESGATENLWLNLSTGYIGSGRRQPDGSGGTGAALRHFEETGRKYPLCVKLGTITPYGADVYSYAEDEDDMVIDPFLSKHLAHWSINMQTQVQTSKTMNELQIDLNLSHEWNTITEAGASLTPISGPGYIGLTNLGNSCYMNSLFQLFASLPAFGSLYHEQADSIFRTAPGFPANDVITMMAKVFNALLSDRYGKKEECDALEDSSESPMASGHVRPAMLKAAVAKRHPEFSSGRQQDIAEYFQYILDTVGPAERSAAGKRFPEKFTLDSNDLHGDRCENMEIDGDIGNGIANNTRSKRTRYLPLNYFRFAVEDRIQCKQSGGVRHKISQENVLELPIPKDEAVVDWNADDGEDGTAITEASKRMKSSPIDNKKDASKGKQIQWRVPFDSCMKAYFGVQTVEGFLSPATGKEGIAEKSVRFQTFPEYLVICLRRYYVAEDWTPKKLEVRVDVPEHLDLTEWRARGLQEGEIPLKEEELTADESQQEDPSSGPGMDPSVIQQIVAMGFSENGAKRAVINTGNSGVEAALQWVFSHSEDADFNDPLPEHSSSGEPTVGPGINAAAVSTLETMGFPRSHAVAALKESRGDVTRATDWLFSNVDIVDEVIKRQTEEEQQALLEKAESEEESLLDGSGIYTLVGFASHMGKNTSCGHYVAHIKKEGRFVLYNDEKVAISQHPPKDLGYLYIYERARTT